MAIKKWPLRSPVGWLPAVISGPSTASSSAKGTYGARGLSLYAEQAVSITAIAATHRQCGFGTKTCGKPWFMAWILAGSGRKS